MQEKNEGGRTVMDHPGSTTASTTNKHRKLQRVDVISPAYSQLVGSDPRWRPDRRRHIRNNTNHLELIRD
jgi:hypothetical protein